MEIEMEMEIETDLNKTMKIKDNENIFVSVRASKKNKSPKNYLTPTVSSINKITSKHENTIQKNQSYMSKTSSPIKRKKSKGNLLSNVNISFSKSLNYNDNLNHFTNDSDFGYDIYGHFN